MLSMTLMLFALGGTPSEEHRLPQPPPVAVLPERTRIPRRKNPHVNPGPPCASVLAEPPSEVHAEGLTFRRVTEH
jgi:hypothetical protein